MGEGDKRQCEQCKSWSDSGHFADGDLSGCWFCEACWGKWEQPALSSPPVARPAPDSNSDSWQLLSEASPFRSQQLRLLFRFAGADFEDRQLSDTEAHACRSGSAGDASPLPLDMLPAVIHGSRVVATVAGAMQYVGECLDLGCEPGAPRCRALMVVIGVEAMRNEAFYPAHDKICETRTRIAAFPMEGYNKWFGHFERYLRVSAAKVETPGVFAGPFVFGKEPCYADLCLYDGCTAIIDLGCYGRDDAERAHRFPRLCALLDAVESHPRMAGYGRPHADALRAIAGDLPPVAPSTRPAPAAIWEVVGGGDAGGVLVREEKSTSSKAEAQRLATGSLVKQLEMEGERMRYERLSGTGPDKGWVSIAVKGKELLTKTAKRPFNPPLKGHDAPLPPAEGEWRVLYYVNASRGQQLRQMFIFSGVPFEDKRLSDEDVQFYKSRFARDTSPLAYDFVPIVQHGDLNMCTTAGALQYIAENLGLASDDILERSKMTMLVVASELMRNEVVYTIYHPMRRTRKRVGYYDPGPYHMWLSRFERYLRTSAADAEAVGAETGPYLLGSKFFYADLVLFDCLSFIIDLGCYGRDEVARAKQYPRVCALIDAVGRHPNLADYGRPHAEDLVLRVGTLPPPRSPADPPPPAPPPLPRRELLQRRLAETEQALREAAGSGADPAPDRQGGIEVVTGSSRLMAEHPGIVEHLSAMINSAYEESVRDNPARQGQHKTVSPEDVFGRLSIGDHGTRNNRVLHVAFRGKKAVGCISSSFSTPWTPKGVGHWGLLAVDTSAQGKGVATALVSTAMRRLASCCDEAHIEYFFTANHPYSERLKSWYDGKLGFRTISANPTGRSTTFQVGRRDFTPEEKARGRRAFLRELREEVSAELKALDAAPAAADGLRCREVFKTLSRYVQARGTEIAPHIGAAFQFDIIDAGPEGKFFIDLRPDMVCAWYGEDSTADCSIQTSDADLDEWLSQRLQGDHAFWSGRAVVTDPNDQSGKLLWVFSEACNLNSQS